MKVNFSSAAKREKKKIGRVEKEYERICRAQDESQTGRNVRRRARSAEGESIGKDNMSASREMELKWKKVSKRKSTESDQHGDHLDVSPG